MRIIMLGTGHAVVTNCYNTCWVLQDDEGQGLLVDAGGGSGIVTQMERAGIAWHTIHEAFVTHKHIDHLLGMVWMLRIVGMEMRRGTYVGDLHIYGNEEALSALGLMAHTLLWDVDNSLLGERIFLETVAPGQRGTLLGRPVTFFDTLAHDVSQLGFVLEYEPGHRLACCGDVSLKKANYPLVSGVDWLLHESFCLSDHPAASFIHRAGHSTVAEAAGIAQQVGARNLLLYHTEDGELDQRRARYEAEARGEFSGALWVPEDLECLEL